MDEIVKTVAAIQIEQASAKALLAENTETINEIKTDTADMLEVFESWKGAMRREDSRQVVHASHRLAVLLARA